MTMESTGISGSNAVNPIAALRRFSRPRTMEEQCDLCAATLTPEHQHLLEPAVRQVSCVCDACAVLFGSGQQGKYLRVPRRLARWVDFQISDMQWAGLGVPIALAFFVKSSVHGQMTAVYPSPGGATEAILPEEVWTGMVVGNPELKNLETDVEALLVNRVSGAREYYRAPIDECYKLVGLIRTYWKGMSGGDEVWRQIESFFEDLSTRAEKASAHA